MRICERANRPPGVATGTAATGAAVRTGGNEAPGRGLGDAGGAEGAEGAEGGKGATAVGGDAGTAALLPLVGRVA